MLPHSVTYINMFTVYSLKWTCWQIIHMQTHSCPFTPTWSHIHSLIQMCSHHHCLTWTCSCCCCCCCYLASVVSDSVWPHRWQPTRLPCPWNSPGKNTGVGCHFLLQFMKVKTESEVVQSCPTLHDPMDCSLPGSSVHGIFQARVLKWGAIAFSTWKALLLGPQILLQILFPWETLLSRKGDT